MILLIVALCEGTARFLYPSQETRLDVILSILEQDPTLIWRFKPNARTTFQGVPVSINSFGFRSEDFSPEKSDGAKRIFCMGASPTFGWGVTADKAYSEQLERLLQDFYKDKQIEVINAGIIGYSSLQGRRLLEEKILSYSPDLLIVAYVINDVDANRFFRSVGRPDKELEPLKEPVVFLMNLFSKSRFYQLLKKGIDTLIFRSSISGRRGGFQTPVVRVDLEDYSLNLKAILALAQENNIHTLFLKMPVNLPLPPPVPEAVRARADHLIQASLDQMKKNEFDDAAAKLKEAISLIEHSSEAHYYLGVCYEHQREYSLAEEAFRKAKDCDAFRCRIDSETYNSAMERIAGKNGIPLVDIVSAFKGEKEKKLFREEIR